MFEYIRWCWIWWLVAIMLDNVKLINRSAYLIGGLAVFLLLFSFVDYGVRTWFLIKRVTISGDLSHISAKQLSYVVKNRLEGNLFTLDIDNLQEEFRAIPWVKDVTVSRQFPNAITIGLSEYVAVARLNDEGLITQSGKVFVGADDNTSLPVFDVPLTNIRDALSDYKHIKPILEIHQVSLRKLTVNGIGITKVELSNNLHITMCGSNITSQMERLDQYWDKLYALNPGLNYVNMCYKDALAMNDVVKAKSAESSSVATLIKPKEMNK